MRNCVRSISANWSLVAVCSFGLIPLAWFRPGYMINGTDIDFPLFSVERFLHRLQTWDIHFLGGTDRSNNVASLPFVAISAMFERMGFDPIMVEKLSFVLWLTLIGLSMHFLMTQIIGKEKGFGSELAKLSASLLYTCGFYNVFLWLRLQLSVTTLILMPVFLGLLIAVIQGRIKLITAMAVMILVAILCGPTGIQPPLVYIFFLFGGVFFLFFVYAYPGLEKKKSRFGKYSVVYLGLIVSYVVGSLYWLFPLANFVVASGYGDAAVGREIYNVKSLLDWTSSVTSLLNVFRFFGDIPWFDSWGGQRYFPEFLAYQTSLPLILTSILIPIAVFSVLINKKAARRQFYVVFFSLTVLIGLFLSKGTHPPFGGLYMWLIDNMPFFWIQRAPWQKFGAMTAVGYAVLFGLAIGWIIPFVVNRLEEQNFYSVRHAHTYLSVGFVIVFLALFIWYHWVFFSGRMFSFGEGEAGFHETYGLGFHHKFPEYIYPARKFVNDQQDDFKLFLLPDDKTNVYRWGYGGSAEVGMFLYNKGIVFRQYGEGQVPPNSVDALQDRIVRELYTSPSEKVTRLLGLLNVKYVVQRNDFWYDFFGDKDSPDFISNQLGEVPGLKMVRRFGEWDFYEVSSNYRAPQIYLSSRAEVFLTDQSQNGQEKVFEKILEINFQRDDKPDAVINEFVPDHLRKVVSTNLQREKLPTVEYRRIAATKYIAVLRNLVGFEHLVFSESFHKQWKAYVVPRTGFYIRNPADYDQGSTRGQWSQSTKNGQLPKGSIFQTWRAESWQKRKTSQRPLLLPNATHALANGYANSWLIDGEEICQNDVLCTIDSNGRYTITIVLEFWPQRLFFIGTFIAGVGGTTAICYLIGLALLAAARKTYRKSDRWINW